MEQLSLFDLIIDAEQMPAKLAIYRRFIKHYERKQYIKTNNTLHF